MSSSIFDTTKIFLAGHGMGAMVAPLAAARDGGLAGVILLSAPARPLHEQLLDIIDKDSKTSSGKASAVDFREQGARSFLDSLKYRNLPRQQMLFVAPVGVWYDIMDADPVATAKSLTIPLLLVQSGRDAKTSETDFQIWKKALKGKNNVTAKQFPDLNHYYQPGHGPATADEFRTNPAPVDSRIIDLLETWIKSR